MLTLRLSRIPIPNGLTLTGMQMQKRSSRRIQRAGPREESPLTELEDDQPVLPPKKRRRTTKAIEPLVYDIPPVESKTTTYRGIFYYYHVVSSCG